MGASFKNQQAFPCSVQQMVAVIKDPAFCKKLNLKAVEVARENVGEEPQEQSEGTTPRKRSTPGSVAFVPSVAGLIIASEVVKDIIK